ncbi:MAG TPA: hypothetical protein DCY61_05005 [Dehalococcoidia bacterium]|nr:hypothetical protein [Dehalococcoidia bacterium]
MLKEGPTKNLLPRLSTRREYFDYLDRWTVGTVDDLRTHMTTRALVKAYLLETSRFNGSRDALAALGSLHQEISPVDDRLHRLRWRGEESDWALVEVADQRYPALYTALESDTANKRVDRLIQGSPLLDRAWFAAPMFQHLWQLVLDAYPPHRFSQIVFEHESLYEVFADDLAVSSVDNELDDTWHVDDEDMLGVERRRTRMQITERIGKLGRALPRMRPEYEPLESIVRLRIPAPHRGGHDVYFDGKFTNRSDSISSLLQTIQMVTSIYSRLTELAEEAAWPHTADMVTGGAQPISLGNPVLVKFGERLELATFERWIAVLRRKNNRFRLWGNPIRLGEGKVHIYAVDNHLWQPIDLEITRDHLYALLPAGTCGNTIHRLVTNLQRFIAPRLETYIGDQRYEDFIAQALAGTVSGHNSHD